MTRSAKPVAKQAPHLGRSTISGQLVMKPVVRTTAARAKTIREAVRKVLAEHNG